MIYAYGQEVDGRCKYMLAVDTETCGELESPLVYDIGVKVFDQQGRIYESESYVVGEIYCGERELMETAYYAKKLPQYEQDIYEGERKMVKLMDVFYQVRRWMKIYNIKDVVAYNTSFDKLSLNHTLAYVTGGQYRYFFPYGTRFVDVWNMACSTIFQRVSFLRMAYECGWWSGVGNVRTNAEVAYSYLTNQPHFEESHTALEDVEIEIYIYLRCRKAGCKAEDMGIIKHPWRKPQPYWDWYEAKMNGII